MTPVQSKNIEDTILKIKTKTFIGVLSIVVTVVASALGLYYGITTAQYKSETRIVRRIDSIYYNQKLKDQVQDQGIKERVDEDERLAKRLDDLK